MTALIILFIASLWAGTQNALAGGGSFITLPSLMLTGMDARAANITSTVALFPAQLITGFTGRVDAKSPPGLTMRTLVLVSLLGGGIGALILLATPRKRVRAPRAVARPVRDRALRLGQLFSPVGRRGRRPAAALGHGAHPIPHRDLRRLFWRRHRLHDDGRARHDRHCGAQCRSDQEYPRRNGQRVGGPDFPLFQGRHWQQALVTAAGASFGGWAGALMLKSVNERLLKLGVVAIGVALTMGLFWSGGLAVKRVRARSDRT